MINTTHLHCINATTSLSFFIHEVEGHVRNLGALTEIYCCLKTPNPFASEKKKSSQHLFAHPFPEVNPYLQVGFLPREFPSRSHIWLSTERYLFASHIPEQKPPAISTSYFPNVCPLSSGKA